MCYLAGKTTLSLALMTLSGYHIAVPLVPHSCGPLLTPEISHLWRSIAWLYLQTWTLPKCSWMMYRIVVVPAAFQTITIVLIILFLICCHFSMWTGITRFPIICIRGGESSDSMACRPPDGVANPWNSVLDSPPLHLWHDAMLRIC